MSQISISQEGASQPPSRGNRRATIRYRCAPATVGKVFSADDQEFQRAWILNLSRHGIGMQLPRPIEIGHLIIIVIRSNDGLKLHEIAARVKRCASLLSAEWVVGCELTAPLTPEELDQLL